ncbi:Eh domain binding protein epsin [Giardia duodenalis assemblage B]|uniref:Eh domain binding protein epsin n=2 Tax=Giardia intestinalis TaxID=5741 RepID=A0A132NUH3_GIAIN|nr:Eh domain binding protein epsin [Giardia intestinalis]KWX13729.1 Eh domain binding protein epsin [Giardia intestinalis assemblage B]
MDMEPVMEDTVSAKRDTKEDDASISHDNHFHQFTYY